MKFRDPSIVGTATGVGGMRLGVRPTAWPTARVDHKAPVNPNSLRGWTFDSSIRLRQLGIWQRQFAAGCDQQSRMLTIQTASQGSQFELGSLARVVAQFRSLAVQTVSGFRRAIGL